MLLTCYPKKQQTTSAIFLRGFSMLLITHQSSFPVQHRNTPRGVSPQRSVRRYPLPGSEPVGFLRRFRQGRTRARTSTAVWVVTETVRSILSTPTVAPRFHQTLALQDTTRITKQGRSCGWRREQHIRTDETSASSGAHRGSCT